MEGIDWFWLFMIFCLFGYITSRDISKVMTARFQRLNESIYDIHDKLDQIQHDLHLVQKEIEYIEKGE